MDSGAHGQQDSTTVNAQDQPYSNPPAAPQQTCPPGELRAYLAAVAEANGLTVRYEEEGGGGGGYEMPILTPNIQYD